MPGRGKIFELLDFPKFAYPSVVGMDAAQTSQNLIERLGGGGFMSYTSIWPRMAAIVEGRATEAFIENEWNLVFIANEANLCSRISLQTKH